MKKFISIVIGGVEQYISASDITAVDVASPTSTVIFYANGTKATLVTVAGVAATATAEWNKVRKSLAETSWHKTVQTYKLDATTYTSVSGIVIATI